MRGINIFAEFEAFAFVFLFSFASHSLEFSLNECHVPSRIHSSELVICCAYLTSIHMFVACSYAAL